MTRSEAKERKQSYYHGKPCKNCGNTLKRGKSSCVECEKKNRHKWDKKYIKNNKETRKETQKKYKENNKDVTARNKSDRRARKINQTSSTADKRKIADIFKEAQRLTKETGKQWDVHHIIPLEENGLEHQDNMIPMLHTDHVKWHSEHRKLNRSI